MFGRSKARSSRRTDDPGPGKRSDGSGRPDTVFREPLYPGYQSRFGKEAGKLFKVLVPSRGPAPTLQGELLRAVEKLWFEGQDNGNINWCSDFEIFLDLLGKNLQAPGELDEADLAMATRSLAVLRACGRTAYQNKPGFAVQGGQTADEERYPGLLEPSEEVGYLDLGYTFDDVYQHLRDCVVVFVHNHPEPIAYQAPEGFGH